mmetsp:Transcript_58477/g.169670  ORF Transcript_58477/g.169670 Transcript_58477/m.169670 type:complete len:95 (+) Transcript_58477:106-390(+)
MRNIEIRRGCHGSYFGSSLFCEGTVLKAPFRELGDLAACWAKKTCIESKDSGDCQKSRSPLAPEGHLDWLAHRHSLCRVGVLFNIHHLDLDTSL